MSLPRNQILIGDALDRVRALPEASVDCEVTSPAYFRLRNYDHDNQLGLEAHVDEWVAGLRTLLTEVRWVLETLGRRDGLTEWPLPTSDPSNRWSTLRVSLSARRRWAASAF